MIPIVEHVFPVTMEGFAFHFPKGLYGNVDVICLDGEWQVRPVRHIVTRGPGDDGDALPITRIDCTPIVGIPGPVIVRVVWV